MKSTIFLLGIFFTTTTAAMITCAPSKIYVIADPDDCTKFYQCFYGHMTHYSCSDGSYYDTDKQSCIHSDNITCNDITVVSTLSTTDYFTVTLPEITTDSTETSAEVSDVTSPYSTQPSPFPISTESSTELPDTTVPLSSTAVSTESSPTSSTESPDITYSPSESSPELTESSTVTLPEITTDSTETSAEVSDVTSPYSTQPSPFPISTESSTELSDTTVPLSSTAVPTESSPTSSTESPDITYSSSESSSGLTESSTTFSDSSHPISSTPSFPDSSPASTTSWTEFPETTDSTSQPTESSTLPYSLSSHSELSTDSETAFSTDTTTFTPTDPITFTILTSTQPSGLPNCTDSSEGFFPYPYDCQFYYECIDGIPELYYCVPGYNWNIEINACDPEENVDCSHISTHKPITSTTPEPTTPTTPSDNPEITCPDTNGTTYYAYPYDCAYFYECRNGEKTLLRCADEYLWNDEKHICDLASHVDCSHISVSPEPTTPTDNSKPTTEAIETSTIENRCRGQPEGTFLPDLDDCSKYVRCDYGIEVEQHCANGTIWSETVLTCVSGSC